MGACIDTKTVETTIYIRAAFNKVKEECIREYGDDLYNGKLSTCILRRTFDNDKPYNKNDANKIIKSANETMIPKGEAYGYSLGIVGYRLTTVHYDNINNKPVYKKGFTVYYNNPDDFMKIEEEDFSNKSDAKEFAIKCALKGSSIVSIDSTYILENGNAVVGKVSSETKIVNKMPKTIKPNQECLPIYKYYFIGLAYC